MANIRDTDRINSVKDTMKITNAMYMISSSKLTQARKKLGYRAVFLWPARRNQREYSVICRTCIMDIFSARENVPEGERKIGSIVITADKGLAGAYNHNIVKLEEEILARPGIHKLFIVGELGRHYFSKAGRADRYQFSLNIRYKIRRCTGRGIFRGSARPVQGEGIGRDLYCLYEDGKFCSGRSRSNEASSA